MTLNDVAARLHGRSRANPRPASGLLRSLVCVLDDAQLDEALDRAIGYERRIAMRSAENISRYEQIARRAKLAAVPDLVPGQLSTPGAEASTLPQSA